MSKKIELRDAEKKRNENDSKLAKLALVDKPTEEQRGELKTLMENPIHDCRSDRHFEQ